MTELVSFTSRAGKPATGEIAYPSARRAPGVVLVHEWWGLNGHVRSLLTRLADAGFVALAPDLYHDVATKDPAEAGRRMAALDWTQALDELAGAAVSLGANPRTNGKVGVTGFCMGGALCFAAAASVADFDAVVPFYGIPDAARYDWSRVRAPIQAHFAFNDRWAKADAARALKSRLDELGRQMELHVYDAQHAFVNDTRPEVYDAASAKLAWERMVAFLHAALD